MKGLVILALVLIIIPFSFSLVFNEVMYDPAGNDNNKEFIEVYDINYVNLSKFIIADGSSNDTLVEIKYFNSGYALIVEEGFNYSKVNASIYSVGATIGNNLGNTEENLTLFYPNKSIVTKLRYFSEWGANGNGYSLEKIDQSVQNTESNWHTSFIANGTPGEQNSVFGLQGFTYNQIQITEIFPDPEGNDTDKEFIELYNPTEHDIDLKWSYFKDLANHKFIITDMTAGTTVIHSKDYRVIHILGFQGLLNNDQDEIKLYDESGTLIDDVSYAQTVEGNSYALVNGYWQNTKPTPGEENVDYNQIKDSSIEILKIYDLGNDKTAEFGQTIRIRLKIYKGDSSKSEVRAWIEKDEKASKETTANIYSRYASYEMTLPIQIKPNCDDKLESGKYDIKVQGLDVSDEDSVNIEGRDDAVCDETAPDVSNSKFSYSFADYPNVINANRVFTIKVEINGDENPHDLEIWSYVYRGSKTYSGEREENKQKIHIPADGSLLVELQNAVIDAEPGDYKIKVKIQKDDQKTLKELTGDLRISNDVPGIACDASTIPQTNCNLNSIFNSAKPYALSTVVFESSQRKAEELLPYFIGTIMTLTTLFLLFSRT